MPRQRAIGKIEPVQKVWFSKKEAAAYLGVTERYMDENINKRPDVDLYRLSGRCMLYSKENLDRVILRSRI